MRKYKVVNVDRIRDLEDQLNRLVENGFSIFQVLYRTDPIASPLYVIIAFEEI